MFGGGGFGGEASTGEYGKLHVSCSAPCLRSNCLIVAAPWMFSESNLLRVLKSGFLTQSNLLKHVLSGAHHTEPPSPIYS